jgi:hypothetical protein
MKHSKVFIRMESSRCSQRKRSAAIGSGRQLNIAPIIRRPGGEGKHNHNTDLSDPDVRERRAYAFAN